MRTPPECPPAQCWNCPYRSEKCIGPMSKQIEKDALFEEIRHQFFTKDQNGVLETLMKWRPGYYSSYRQLCADLIDQVGQEMEGRT